MGADVGRVGGVKGLWLAAMVVSADDKGSAELGVMEALKRSQ